MIVPPCITSTVVHVSCRHGIRPTTRDSSAATRSMPSSRASGIPGSIAGAETARSGRPGGEAMRRVLGVSDLADVAPFVDRVQEQALIRKLAAEAAAGSPRVLLVQGEAGIGKSRLLDEALRGTHARRASCQQ